VVGFLWAVSLILVQLWAEIKPLFQKGTKNNIANYKCVSLFLTSFSKVFKVHVCKTV
jgi:hypothetical protein